MKYPSFESEEIQSLLEKHNKGESLSNVLTEAEFDIFMGSASAYNAGGLFSIEKVNIDKIAIVAKHLITNSNRELIFCLDNEILCNNEVIVNSLEQKIKENSALIIDLYTTEGINDSLLQKLVNDQINRSGNQTNGSTISINQNQKQTIGRGFTDSLFHSFILGDKGFLFERKDNETMFASVSDTGFSPELKKILNGAWGEKYQLNSPHHKKSNNLLAKITSFFSKKI